MEENQAMEHHKLVLLIPVEQIHPSPHQPRRRFNEAKLAELAASIKERGVQQPILIRKLGEADYELIMGERRLRASKIAGKNAVPAIVTEETDDESAVDALTENIQRENLTPLEEARAFAALIDRFGGDVSAVAFKVSKTEKFVRERVELLKLTEPVQQMLDDERINLEQAKILLQIEDAEAQLTSAQLAAQLQLTANQLKGRTQHLRKAGDGSVAAPKRVTPKKFSAKLVECNDLAENFHPGAKFRSDERQMIGMQIDTLMETLRDTRARIAAAPIGAEANDGAEETDPHNAPADDARGADEALV